MVIIKEDSSKFFKVSCANWVWTGIAKDYLQAADFAIKEVIAKPDGLNYTQNLFIVDISDVEKANYLSKDKIVVTYCPTTLSDSGFHEKAAILKGIFEEKA